MIVRLLTFATGLLLILPAAVGTVAAQNYPSRPIRMIIPFGVGGSTDVLARLIAPRMSEHLGQSIIVDNRGGGAGLPAYKLVSEAAPDGHTILFAGSNFAANPILFKKLPYDTERDFAPISLVAIIPMVLVVNPSLPVESVKDLIALAKSKPGVLNFGSVGNGSGPHLTAEVFNDAARLKVEHVPYKGAAAALTDLSAGRITYVFGTTTSTHPFIASGRIKPLAVSSQKRSLALPQVPTISESGIPGFDVNIWLGLLAPAGTPDTVISQLNATISKVLQHPKVQEQFARLGAAPMGGSPADFKAHLTRELTRWVNLAKTVQFEVAN